MFSIKLMHFKEFSHNIHAFPHELKSKTILPYLRSLVTLTYVNNLCR